MDVGALMMIQRWRWPVLGIVLIAGLMAMALSCGGSSDSASPATASDTGARTQPESAASAQAAATQAPRPASSTDDSTGRVQSEALVEVQAGAAGQKVGDAEESGQDGAGASTSGETGSLQVQSGRQLIVEGWIGLEVDEIDAVVRQVETVATQRGGWVESTDILGEAGYRTASINVRIPAERFDNAMETLRGLGRVSDEGVSSTDVTDRLIDNEARMNAWRTQEDRLIILLENAATVEDVIDIERRISEVRADIETVAATQRNLSNRVAASLIRVNLHLPGRFAADPPHGSLILAVGDPSATADVVAGRVESLNGYIGRKREYQQEGGQVVELAAFVRSTDLAGLMDYAATLGEPSERQLNSVGPSLAGNVPNARLSLVIRSNVDSAATLSLYAAEPIAVAGEIRQRAESLGGYVESWDEFRRDEGKRENINMELLVRASDLRDIMDFGSTLGKAENWQYRSIGQGPTDAAPNARLTVLVHSGDDRQVPWTAIVGFIGGIAVASAIVVASALVWRRRARRNSTRGIADLETGTE